MGKQTKWNKTLIAQNYDFGRPLDEKIIIELFTHLKNLIPLLSGQKIISSPLKGEDEGEGKKVRFETFNADYNRKPYPFILDAGCGTGRITVPVARHIPNLQITGIDISEEMLAVLRRKISKSKIKNYQIIKGDLLKLNIPDNTFTITLISSVLHGIENWKIALNELIRVTRPSGYLLLISEEDDVTNIALGKFKKAKDKLLEAFWKKYVEFHFKYRLGRLDKPQVGIKWQLGHPEVIQYLKDLPYASPSPFKGEGRGEGNQIKNKKHVFEKKKIVINWKKEFTVADFMKIIEGRPWSIMFTADGQKYSALIADMKNWLKQQNISPQASSTSNNILKCEIVKIRK